MPNLQDPDVQKLFEDPNYAVISTLNPDGSILSTMVWVELHEGQVSVNSAEGRRWPSNLQREPRVTLLVFDNPYRFVEIRGRATVTREDADDQINRLAKKYIGQDEYPFRQPGEVRLKFVIEPERVRFHAQD